ncbi:thioredoxin [Candidatus Woesearchaeota archaeon]|nr:thioredoxin [Candidatus Woesearchaeota archaeon]
MLQLSGENFEKEVVESKIPVIVDFWAEWCAPCRMIAPVFEKLSFAYSGKLKFAKINVDESHELAEKYSIRAIPCLAVFSKGREIGRIVGALQEDMLKVKIGEIAKL